MKKTLLALAVAAASLSTAATAATVYKDDTTTLNMGGRVEVRANLSEANKSDDGSKDDVYDDASRVRFNLGGEHKLNNDVSFMGFAEWEITESDEAKGDDALVNTRYLYTGVTSQKFGALTVGHQDNAFTYLTNFTDMAEVFSGYINERNTATSDRANNVLRYAYNNDNLTIQASGQLNSDDDGDHLTQNADGFGVIGAYKFTDSFELGLGYAQTDASADGSDNTATGDNFTYTVAGRYTNNGMLLAATYEGGSVARSSSDESDFNAADLYAGYTFGDNNVNMTYNYFDADENGFEEYNLNNVAVEYARYFGNATVYGAYQFNLLSESDAANTNQTEDQFQVGFRYAF